MSTKLYSANKRKIKNNNASKSLTSLRNFCNRAFVCPSSLAYHSLIVMYTTLKSSGHDDGFDELLAKELHGLSLKEREQVFHDIHGVSESLEETPAFVAQKLAELDLNVSKKKKRYAYDRAKAQNPEYVSSRRFRLAFLRAEKFDAEEAATRLVRFCEEKLLLFGEERLGRDITMQDFSKEDLDCVQSGMMQVSKKHHNPARL